MWLNCFFFFFAHDLWELAEITVKWFCLSPKKKRKIKSRFARWILFHSALSLIGRHPSDLSVPLFSRYLQVSLMCDREHGWGPATTARPAPVAPACSCRQHHQHVTLHRADTKSTDMLQNAAVMSELLLSPPPHYPSLICGGYSCIRTSRGDDLIGCDWAPTCSLRPEQPKQTSHSSLSRVLKTKSAQSWHASHVWARLTLFGERLPGGGANVEDLWEWNINVGRWWLPEQHGFNWSSTILILPQHCRSCENTNLEPRERSVKLRV